MADGKQISAITRKLRFSDARENTKNIYTPSATTEEKKKSF